MGSRCQSSLTLFVALVCLLAGAALGGCATEPDSAVAPVPESDTSTRIAQPDATLDATAEWLAGSWNATYTLDAVTAAVFEEEAQIGQATVVIEASGSQMSLLVDGVTYTGVVVFGESEFRFEGSTTYEEDDGSISESDAIMSGARTGDDSWTGDTWADFRSDGAYVYEAVWMQEATRSP